MALGGLQLVYTHHDLQSYLAPFLRAQKLRKGVVARGGVNLCASGLRIEAL